MRRSLKWVAGGVLWLAIIACLASVLVPPFLDRIYYRGPATDHFDGDRFFNPDGDDSAAPPGGGSRAGFFWRRLTGEGEVPWPGRVPVTPDHPPARVSGGDMRVTWVGHATVLVQAGGLNILTDPIWSPRAGPFGLGPARVTEPGIALDDLPTIDLIVISHNHYDHLDLSTLKQLWARDRPRIVTSLGNDSVISAAGVPATAVDWGRAVSVAPGVAVHVVRNHHWGSRWFADRNRALWSAFVVTLPGGNLFFAGDTGFGDGEWPREAAALGPIRLALIPIGAFRFTPGQMGTGSHIGPPDAMRVWDRMGQPMALPVHWGTFKLSAEGRETPPRMLDALMACAGQDRTRFQPRAPGAPWSVPPLAGVRPRPLDQARLTACAQTPAVTTLP
ncbi:MBL fold metallo-hydrolase [Sphingomonas sp.]|uniref:MBL fold metallo-hydrolase n=1 Tax=Sphingomonas sp. TaxID=28214 RepID=UPI002D0EFAB2|nr:MBL fold metallo-hydrolase [Sphingomonas sp.]HTG39483.1 MBL fold metallo-hydrolase [Sphingomonas sp.]